MSLRSPILHGGLALLVAVSPVFAQKNKGEPSRPPLPAGADTNDARAYYDFGLSKLEREPDRAADAFYWAVRFKLASQQDLRRSEATERVQTLAAAKSTP